jgi:hypothetical protein
VHFWKRNVDSLVSHLKHNGYYCVCTTWFTIRKLSILSQSAFMFFSWFSEQTALTCSLETRCVSCEVGTEFLNIVYMSLIRLQRVRCASLTHATSVDRGGRMPGDDVICDRPGQHHRDDVAWATRETDPCRDAPPDPDGVCSEPLYRSCWGCEAVKYADIREHEGR